MGEHTLRSPSPGASARRTEPSTTIVSVTFNSSHVVSRMLASVPEHVPVIIVDNASTDIDKTRSLAARYGARLICNTRNAGFGSACNQAAAVAATEFILFLNPDAVLSTEALDRLADAANRYPEASAFNPWVGIEGRQFFRTTNPIELNGWSLPAEAPDHDCEVPVLSGAALFVRSTAFESVGGFDENIFLYFEDDDLSLRLRRDCGPLMFVRDARVTHRPGRSTENCPSLSKMKGWHFGYSRVLVSQKHNQPFAFGRAMLRALRKICNVRQLLSVDERQFRIGFFGGVLAARNLNTATLRNPKQEVKAPNR